ncbi:serine/threonine protein kinase [Sphaerotilus microaerophilus]|uniref:Protein kinase domain-containing protein n=1 Tax=Sphaerotilus microaerophilus TaxID=2914710 RepID=A0ABM7YKM4_9BURK|nr:serine/threonine-protein kinase [Sphaerotilus sp. FB-5]BDI04877.1 hypothetical protein CATMQ487_18470 [Sphaerotilus sp. FB-5]
MTMPDDDRTRMPPAGATRSAATTLTTALPPAALPPGTALAEFVIEGTIGEGGFGIVYRAHDTQLQRTVAVKEYMPASLAMRAGDGQITLRSERHRETFELGLRSFINEARLLAAFDHPALLKVYRFWEDHGTAYMVMPCYEGITLKDWLKERRAATGQPPDEAWWRERLPPLLDALALMHGQHCYHRDVAPDNIMLVGEALQPLLLDFGAARRVIGDATQALTVILKPGYAPVEQYAEVASMKQGPWTDVYALCAVLYCALTGAPPPPAVGRMVRDECVPVRVACAGRYSEDFLATIDAGLAVRPEDRPQDMAALAQRLGLVPQRGQPVRAAAAPPPGAVGVSAATAGAATSALPSTATAAPAVRRGGRWVVGAVAATLVLLAAGWVLLGRRPAPPDASVAGATAATPAASAIAPGLGGAAAAASSPGTAVGSAVAVPPLPPPPARGPFSPVAALEEVLRTADAAIQVDARADQERLVIDRDRLQFRLRGNVTGHVYVLFVGTDGRALQMLFPNAIDADNRLAAGQELVLPRPKWRITAGGAPGTDHVLVLLSPQPRRFEAAGARRDAREALTGFDLALARRAWAAPAGPRSAFAGEAACPTGADCDPRYGAVLLRIDEVAAPGR